MRIYAAQHCRDQPANIVGCHSSEIAHAEMRRTRSIAGSGKAPDEIIGKIVEMACFSFTDYAIRPADARRAGSSVCASQATLAEDDTVIY